MSEMRASDRRNPAIDALRTLAILGMMAAHTSRLILFEARPQWSYWVLLLEPIIPSLFLFLVGISLTHSVAKILCKMESHRAWYLRQLRRALGLWLISALYFAFEEGIRFPDVLLASGILCTIAYAILLTTTLSLFPRPAYILTVALLLGSSVFVWLDQKSVRAFPWIVGNSPLFPLCLFTIAGTLWGLAMRRFPKIFFSLGLAAFVGALYAGIHYGWIPIFTIPLGRSDATRTLAHTFMGSPEKTVGYYNLRPLLALFCFCVHIGILGVATAILSPLKERASTFLIALGRHSLGAYILHLSLLAILVVSFGLHPLKTSTQGTGVLACVILICWIWAYLVESGILPRKPKKFV